MTDDELAVIRANVQYRQRVHDAVQGPEDAPFHRLAMQCAALLAEVERLRDYEAGYHRLLTVEAHCETEIEALQAENADLIAVADSLVISPNAKPVLADYRAALAALRIENAALRKLAQKLYTTLDNALAYVESPLEYLDGLETTMEQARALLDLDEERAQQS